MLVLIILSTLLTLTGYYLKKEFLFRIFKPLTTILIIYNVFLVEIHISELYRNIILVGLLFSLMGDILLMWEIFFIYGLLSFLLTHILYIYGFYLNITEFKFTIFEIILVITGLMYFQYLQPKLGKLKFPVLIYISIIVFMGIFAHQLHINLNTIQSHFAIIGSILFIISDAALAFNKFALPFKLAQVLVLSTYYFAQYFITLSI